MKAKTINALLHAKFKAWLESIDDPVVQKAVAGNTIASGGCIASMLLREPVNDFDFYFRDKATTLLVAEYYVKKFNTQAIIRFKNSDKHVDMKVVQEDDRIKIHVKSAGIAAEGETNNYQYFEGVAPESADAQEYVEQTLAVKEIIDETKPKYRPVFLSTNAITLSDGVQLVFRFYGEPDQIHENYDFVHCTNYWTSWKPEGRGHLVLRQAALEALLAKELRYIGSRYPICSLVRIRKFIPRGWTINAGQILKLAMQVNQLNLKDLKVLEDQLTGVDVAYFHEVIAKLKDKNPEAVDTAYLIEILDRIF